MAFNKMMDQEPDSKNKFSLKKKGKSQTKIKSQIYVTILENYRQKWKKQNKEIIEMLLINRKESNMIMKMITRMNIL